MNKFISLSIITSLALYYNNLYGLDSNALPQNPNVKSGIVETSYDKNNLNITQSSQKAIIEWNNFNIGKNATVNFQQPNSNASVLNRVTSSAPSEIFGKLNANGEVFLINPNGVLFGKDSKVDVGSFIVSTMDIKDEDYLKSKYTFNSNNIFGKIINEGELSIKDKGFIALLAPEIINEGVIEAKFGNIALVSGEKINLFFDDKELVSIEVSDSQIKSLIENKKMIITQDGKIFLSAKSKNELLGGIIKNSGHIEANNISSKNGEIFLDSNDSIFSSGELNSKNGTIKLNSKNIEVSGQIDSDNGNILIGNNTVEKTTIKSTASIKSNFVETSAKTLKIEDGVKIEAKEWLLDPTNITIATLGTEALTGIPSTTSTTGDVTVSGATINTSLNSGTSVLLDASNDIIINDNISKSNGTEATLTFKAGNNISISSGKSISSSSNKLNLVFCSDSDGSNSGGITLNSNTSIITNGGHLWLGGGLLNSSWNGLSVGNSYAKGTGSFATGGIEINAATIYTNGGNIKMYGYGPNSGGSGIHFVNSIISTQTNSTSLTANGQIDLRGDGYWASSANGMGIYIDKSSIIGGSSGINLDGHAETTNGQYNYGLYFKTANANDSSNIYTLSNGTLNLNLYANITSGSRNNHFMSNDNGIVNIGGINQTGDINIHTYGTSDAGLYLPNVKTAGNLLIDVSNSSNIGSGISPSWAGTTWGYWDMSANILDIDGTTNIVGNTSKTLSGKFDNIDNDLGGVFSANNLKNLKLTDKNALTLGSLSNLSGTINIATLEGDINLTQNISTSNTSSSAIILNAGKSTSSGISTGGNIIYTSGTISTGVNGRSTLYTGGISGSTALTSLIGFGSGNFRYNSDETTTNYTAALGNGIYEIFREQPILSVTPTTASNIYGNTVSISGVTGTITGYQNGDNISTTTGNATYTTTATNTSSASAYNISYSSGFLNSLGYGFSDASNSIGEYTISPRILSLTADVKTKVYGDDNPNLTYTITSGNLVNSDVLNGTLSTNATQYSNVGNYNVISTLANPNYDVTFNGINKISISPRILSLTADVKTKVYGDDNPNLTYTITSGNLVNSDVLNGTLSTNATQYSNVGNYNVISTLANPNYDVTFNGINKISISPRILSLTADVKTKVYGDDNPNLTYTITSGNLVNSDVLNGTLSTNATQYSNVGNYNVISTLANPNYDVTFNGINKISISPRILSLTADVKTKVYGDDNPNLTYTITSGNLVNSDVLNGTLSTNATQYSNVGNYNVISTLANPNYDVTFNGINKISISPRILSLTADVKTKVYGDDNPNLTYTITSGNLVNSDVLNGTLSTNATQYSNVGNYNVISTLANPNYDVTFNGINKISISPRILSLTADVKTKVYGDDNPNLTYTITSGNLVNSDVLNGTLSTNATQYSNVGNYNVISTLANPNYDVTFNGINKISISPRILSLTADVKTKVYGDDNPNLTYTITSGNLVNSDVLNGTLSTNATQYSNVGNYNVISTLANPNYDVTFNGINKISISPRILSLTADVKTKVYGDDNPNLTYTITSGNLVNSDVLNGTLSTNATQYSNVGNYNVISTLANPNYDVTFNGINKISISPRILSLTADVKTKVYGDDNPNLTYTITGFVNNDDINNINGKAFLKTDANLNSNTGNYLIDITRGTLESQNYDFIFKSGVLKVEKNTALQNNVLLVDSLQTSIKDSLKEKVIIKDLINKEDSLVIEELKTSINKEILKAINNLKVEEVFEIAQNNKIIDLKTESKIENNKISSPILEKQIILKPTITEISSVNNSNIKNDSTNEQIIEKLLVQKNPINLNNELVKNIKTYENDLQQQGLTLANSQAITNNILKNSFSNQNTNEDIKQSLVKAYEIDKNSVNAKLSSSSDLKGDAIFDKIFQNLLQKGVDPKEALKQATTISSSSLKEISFSKQIDSLSDEQVKMTINLIAKGYSKNEAIQMSKELISPKESFKTDIVNGKVDENLKYLDKYLDKHSLEESVKLASKIQEEKRKYEQIDEKNVILSFVELSKKGVIPNSLLFEKILSNELKKSDFKTAYKNALEQYSLLNKTNQDFPLEKLVKGDLKKDLTSNEKIWWIEFTKNIMNGDNQELAKEKATKIEKLFIEKEKLIKDIENRINKGVVR